MIFLAAQSASLEHYLTTDVRENDFDESLDATVRLLLYSNMTVDTQVLVERSGWDYTRMTANNL